MYLFLKLFLMQAKQIFTKYSELSSIAAYIKANRLHILTENGKLYLKQIVTNKSGIFYCTDKNCKGKVSVAKTEMVKMTTSSMNIG